MQPIPPQGGPPPSAVPAAANWTEYALNEQRWAAYYAAALARGSAEGIAAYQQHVQQQQLLQLQQQQQIFQSYELNPLVGPPVPPSGPAPVHWPPQPPQQPPGAASTAAPAGTGAAASMALKPLHGNADAAAAGGPPAALMSLQPPFDHAQPQAGAADAAVAGGPPAKRGRGERGGKNLRRNTLRPAAPGGEWSVVPTGRLVPRPPAEEPLPGLQLQLASASTSTVSTAAAALVARPGDALLAERIEKLASRPHLESVVRENQAGNPEWGFLRGGEGAGYYALLKSRALIDAGYYAEAEKTAAGQVAAAQRAERKAADAKAAADSFLSIFSGAPPAVVDADTRAPAADAADAPARAVEDAGPTTREVLDMQFSPDEDLCASSDAHEAAADPPRQPEKSDRPDLRLVRARGLREIREIRGRLADLADLTTFKTQVIELLSEAGEIPLGQLLDGHARRHGLTQQFKLPAGYGLRALLQSDVFSSSVELAPWIGGPNPGELVARLVLPPATLGIDRHADGHPIDDAQPGQDHSRSQAALDRRKDKANEQRHVVEEARVAYEPRTSEAAVSSSSSAAWLRELGWQPGGGAPPGGGAKIKTGPDQGQRKPSINLMRFASVDDLLREVEDDEVKAELKQLGLKFGGTVEARAERLFQTRGKSLAQLAKSQPELFPSERVRSRPAAQQQQPPRQQQPPQQRPQQSDSAATSCILPHPPQPFTEQGGVATLWCICCHVKLTENQEAAHVAGKGHKQKLRRFQSGTPLQQQQQLQAHRRLLQRRTEQGPQQEQEPLPMPQPQEVDDATMRGIVPHPSRPTAWLCACCVDSQQRAIMYTPCAIRSHAASKRHQQNLGPFLEQQQQQQQEQQLDLEPETPPAPAPSASAPAPMRVDPAPDEAHMSLMRAIADPVGARTPLAAFLAEMLPKPGAVAVMGAEEDAAGCDGTGFVTEDEDEDEGSDDEDEGEGSDGGDKAGKKRNRRNKRGGRSHDEKQREKRLKKRGDDASTSVLVIEDVAQVAMVPPQQQLPEVAQPVEALRPLWQGESSSGGGDDAAAVKASALALVDRLAHTRPLNPGTMQRALENAEAVGVDAVLIEPAKEMLRRTLAERQQRQPWVAVSGTRAARALHRRLSTSIPPAKDKPEEVDAHATAPVVSPAVVAAAHAQPAGALRPLWDDHTGGTSAATCSASGGGGGAASTDASPSVAVWVPMAAAEAVAHVATAHTPPAGALRPLWGVPVTGGASIATGGAIEAVNSATSQLRAVAKSVLQTQPKRNTHGIALSELAGALYERLGKDKCQSIMQRGARDWFAQQPRMFRVSRPEGTTVDYVSLVAAGAPEPDETDGDAIRNDGTAVGGGLVAQVKPHQASLAMSLSDWATDGRIKVELSVVQRKRCRGRQLSGRRRRGIKKARERGEQIWGQDAATGGASEADGNDSETDDSGSEGDGSDSEDVGSDVEPAGGNSEAFAGKAKKKRPIHVSIATSLSDWASDTRLKVELTVAMKKKRKSPAARRNGGRKKKMTGNQRDAEKKAELRAQAVAAGALPPPPAAPASAASSTAPAPLVPAKRKAEQNVAAERSGAWQEHAALPWQCKCGHVNKAGASHCFKFSCDGTCPKDVRKLHRVQ